jgi:hypothetical protein
MSTPTRSSESRIASTRRAIGGQPRGRLDVDLTGLPADMEACFIRERTLGEPDRNNVADAMDRGFEPATRDMLPNAAPRLLPGEEPDRHGLIRVGGQILMVRSKRDGDEEREYRRRDTDEREKAAARVGEAPEAKLDRDNFREDSRVTERVFAGEGRDKPAKPGSRFKDA